MRNTAPTAVSPRTATPGTRGTPASSTATTVSRVPPAPARLSVARQVRQQRRGYAAAVLRGLARDHRGRPVAQVQATLRASLKPLGVRLTPAALRALAADITAGRPVELP